MRYITRLVIVSTLTVLLSSTVSAQAIAGAGTVSCGEMLSAISDERQLEFTFQSWSQGFMSALNRSRFLYGLVTVDINDNTNQWLWLQNYCRDNSSEAFHIAVIELFEDLMSRQRLD